MAIAHCCALLVLHLPLDLYLWANSYSFILLLFVCLSWSCYITEVLFRSGLGFESRTESFFFFFIVSSRSFSRSLFFYDMIMRGSLYIYFSNRHFVCFVFLLSATRSLFYTSGMYYICISFSLLALIWSNFVLLLIFLRSLFVSRIFLFVVVRNDPPFCFIIISILFFSTSFRD